MHPETLVPLPVPVPPMLEQALGYPGQARLVAFFWSPRGDEAMHDDGRCTGVGDWTAYLAFIKHPTVEPHVRPFDLGSSEEEAQHWLVLDRETRTLSVLPVQQAALLLLQQWGIQPALPLRWEALDPTPRFLETLTGKRGWRVVWRDGAPVAQRRRVQEEQVESLCCWLNQQEGGSSD
ncbi:MAG TPA: hypothetical protein VKT82_08485 [Ktedonobacterales bacterium]|nr:hypothetical protein [Ktedonobacterales bacterium]